MKKTNASVYFNEEEKELINQARELSGLSISSFCRTCSIERAREILRKNKEEKVQNAGN